MFDNLTFKKGEILNRLRVAREEHVDIVKEAQAGYREQLQKELEEKLTAVKAGERVKPNIRLHVLDSHVDDYDRAIEMLELCQEDELALTEMQFQCLIRNKWQWQHQFLEANSAYSARAMRSRME